MPATAPRGRAELVHVAVPAQENWVYPVLLPLIRSITVTNGGDHVPRAPPLCTFQDAYLFVDGFFCANTFRSFVPSDGIHGLHSEWRKLLVDAHIIPHYSNTKTALVSLVRARSLPRRFPARARWSHECRLLTTPCACSAAPADRDDQSRRKRRQDPRTLQGLPEQYSCALSFAQPAQLFSTRFNRRQQLCLPQSTTTQRRASTKAVRMIFQIAFEWLPFKLGARLTYAPHAARLQIRTACDSPGAVPSSGGRRVQGVANNPA